jgi:molybdopterin biosynthesis enzyme
VINRERTWITFTPTSPPPLRRQLDGRTVTASLSRNLAGATDREDYVRVRLRREGETTWALSVPGPSGLLSPLVESEGLVMIPLGLEGRVKGEEVTVQLVGGS